MSLCSQKLLRGLPSLYRNFDHGLRAKCFPKSTLYQFCVITLRFRSDFQLPPLVAEKLRTPQVRRRELRESRTLHYPFENYKSYTEVVDAFLASQLVSSEVGFRCTCVVNDAWDMPKYGDTHWRNLPLNRVDGI